MNYSKDFSKAIVKKLAAKGIAIVGATFVPDEKGSYIGAGAETAYILNDNGTSCLRTYFQVKSMAMSSYGVGDQEYAA